MPLTIVTGGQYGGEGKGNVTAFLASTNPNCILVKSGGPNCAHTYGRDGQLTTLRMVPCGALLGASSIVYPAGCLIHVPTLLQELKVLAYDGKILIDPNAGIVTDQHIQQQRDDPFYQSTGSTLTGSGAASACRCLRRLPLARDDQRLAPYIAHTADYLAEQLHQGREVFIEGAQAFGLSNYHGDYPYCTSRDTTAAAILSQLGLGHGFIGSVIMVVKCFPTRNSQGRGQLRNEIDSTISQACEGVLNEYGGGSFGERGDLRQVALFDWKHLTSAVQANTPTGLAVTGLDKLEALLKLEFVKSHYGSTRDFILRLSEIAKVPVILESYGPFIEDVRYVTAVP